MVLNSSRRFTDLLVSGQIALVLGGLSVLAFRPPAQGRMLLIPIGGDSGLASLVLARGALVIGRGPFAGSLVVEGDRARLTRGLLARGVVALAAPPIACGDIRGISR
jgi:hypothetical protein